ncbi:MAG: substrate-binding domain-containing protein, partial [Acidimicrobiia bacterium]
MKSRIGRLTGLVAVVALVLAACGEDGAVDTTSPAGENGGDSSGSIVVSGSSTVEPITARVGEAFDDANPGVATSVEGPGTGDGFARFCAGETDISDASR